MPTPAPSETTAPGGSGASAAAMAADRRSLKAVNDLQRSASAAFLLTATQIEQSVNSSGSNNSSSNSRHSKDLGGGGGGEPPSPTSVSASNNTLKLKSLRDLICDMATCRHGNSHACDYAARYCALSCRPCSKLECARHREVRDLYFVRLVFFFFMTHHVWQQTCLIPSIWALVSVCCDRKF